MDYIPCFTVLSRHYPKNVDRLYGLIWKICGGGRMSCNIPIKTMMFELNLTMPTVIKILNFLKKNNFIAVSQNDKKYTSHIYTIIPETLDKVNAMWKKGELDGR